MGVLVTAQGDPVFRGAALTQTTQEERYEVPRFVLDEKHAMTDTGQGEKYRENSCRSD